MDIPDRGAVSRVLKKEINMFKVKTLVVFVLALLSTMLVLSVQADDGRINPANFHFGGDTLYCEADQGCHILNDHGDLLISWSQDSINAAVQQSIDSNQSVLVSEQQATYGPMGLWVQYVEVNDKIETWHLCLQGYDEWGKSNQMCFKASLDGYQPVGDPAPVKADEKPVADCSAYTVGDSVDLIANPSIWGLVTSINVKAGTLTFDSKPTPTTASCNDVEFAR